MRQNWESGTVKHKRTSRSVECPEPSAELNAPDDQVKQGQKKLHALDLAMHSSLMFQLKAAKISWWRPNKTGVTLKKNRSGETEDTLMNIGFQKRSAVKRGQIQAVS